MNKTILIGRLTADPELRQTAGGVSVCRFTVAVNRKYKNEQGEYEADFISCTAWRQTAEFIAKYFTKGKMIALDGSLRNNNYQDKNHPDVTHYTTEVYVDNAEFCGDRSGSGTGGAQASAPAPNTQQRPQQQPRAAAPQAAAQQPENAFDLSDFEEILSDGDVPF